MKIISKTPFISVVSALFLINLLFKGIFLYRFPNSISTEEIKNIHRVYSSFSMNPYFFRCISLAASIILVLLTVNYLFKKTKNIPLCIFIGIVLTTSPWIFIMSRAFNFYILMMICVLTIFIVFKKYFYRFTLIALILIFFILKVNLNFTIAQIIHPNIDLFFKTIDFKTLFFAGDITSSYLRIPKTGFFLFVDLIALIFGTYSLFVDKRFTSMQEFVISFFGVGVFYFFITPDSVILLYRGLLIFYALSIVIGIGYYALFTFLVRKNILLCCLCALLFLINIFYYQELFYSHFDKKNSSEWGYAEERISKVVDLNGPKVKKIIISPDSGNIIPYLPLFAPHNHDVKLVKLPGGFREFKIAVCLREDTICIFKEHELAFAGIEKEEVKNKVYYFNAIPAYYVISKANLKGL